jgi:ribA/ribD-fused uncharacterized protein
VCVTFRPYFQGVIDRLESRDPQEELALLLQAEREGNLPPIVAFWGHTAERAGVGPWVLSQWWPAPFAIDGVTYHHAEGFMMAEKARLFGDDDALELILDADQPAEAKKLGRGVRNFDDKRWAEVRYDVVLRASLAKFSENEDLRAYLLSTAPAVLVEASPRDRIWGIGLGPDDERVLRPGEWRGRNLLGFALTFVRGLL